MVQSCVKLEQGIAYIYPVVIMTDHCASLQTKALRIKGLGPFLIIIGLQAISLRER